MRFALNSDLALTIEKYIDAVLSERPVRDERAARIAARHRALPLFRGRDGYYALSLSGEVVEFRWKHFDDPEPELFDGRAYGCIAIGALKYPELACLLPARQGDEPACEHCGGTGQHPLAIQHQDHRVICECGGLGFIPLRNDEPTSYLKPITGPAVFPDIVPSTFKMTRFYEICAEHDLKTEEEVHELFAAMFHEPEVEVYYVRPKDGPGNRPSELALSDGFLVQGEQTFYYFRRDENCNFVHVARNEGDDAEIEYMFGYDKRDFLWAKTILQTPMYVRSSLTLSERARRQMNSELSADKNPFEAKPGAFGFSVDLFKVGNLVRGWYRRWASKRRKAAPRDGDV